MALLTCCDLTMGYGSLTAVSNLSFSVEEGDYLCIVGLNGAGKSTLVKGLLGLAAPRSGRIVYDGVKPNEIGYLPQQTAVRRDFPATVWEVVLSGTLAKNGLHLFYTPADRARAETVLAQLGISDLKKRHIRALSGGQLQRVLLARALCAAERLLLLDEPAAALDPSASAELYDLIDHLNRDHGVTILMVTHSMEAVRRSDHVLLMDKHDPFFGTTKDFFHSGRAAALAGGEDHV